MAHEVKLGQLIEGTPGRDAIHIAVAPVVASCKLSPGQDIGFVGSDTTRVGPVEKTVGIVDPFLKRMVYEGEPFWMFLYPNTITSLRHDWEHPAFRVADRESAKNASIQWMMDFARDADMTYEDVIAYATEYRNTGDHFVQQGLESARDAFYQHRQDFWLHFERITGIVVPGQDQEDCPFSCSC